MEENKRPGFLKVLCILSFIGTTIGVISSIAKIFVSNPAIVDALRSVIDNAGQDSSMLDSANFEHVVFYAVAGIILNIIALIGAIMMFNLSKVGFYLYALAQIMMLFVGTIYGGMATFSYFSLIWNTIWIVMYASNLKYMTGCKCGCSCSTAVEE